MTENAIHTIRLIGGRYDGDQAQLNVLPPAIWAYTCDCVPTCVVFNGIHWLYGTAGGSLPHGDDRHPEEYRYSHAEPDAHVYTWKPLMRDPDRGLREALAA